MICYEIRNYLRKGLRAVGVLEGNHLFHIEEATDYWGKHHFRVIHIPHRNPYGAKHGYSPNSSNIGREVKTILEAKQIIREWVKNNPKNDLMEKEAARRNAYPVALLPGEVNPDFYPTPFALAGKMLSNVDWTNVRDILEPSAGKGDLVEAVCRLSQKRQYKDERRANGGLTGEMRNDPSHCFDVIEKDINLRLMLKGSGLRLVEEDFLRYYPQKRYDLVVMNPPFSEGCQHLLHAIELRPGQLVSLLNAETIRNPYTKERQLLKQQLADLNAKIEFVEGAFRNAERKSDVEVAIIYIKFKEERGESWFFQNAEKAARIDFEADRRDRDKYLIVSDEVEALIQNYNYECRAGVDFLRAYDELTPYIMSGSERCAKPLIRVEVDGQDYDGISNSLINLYVKNVRKKYWEIFMNRPELRKLMTSQIANDYHSKVAAYAEYEFNRHNIAQILFEIQSQLVKGVEETIMKLFELFTSKHCMENEKNIHYFNGWKTNKAWKITDRVIVPAYGYFNTYSFQQGKLDEYRVFGFLDDIEKALHYLEKGEPITHWDLRGEIEAANRRGATKLEKLTYFSCVFYKKGTVHIKFHSETMPLIDRLNIFAGRKNAWLPPSYGKKRYQDMDAEERAVIDEFQGEEAYNKVMADPGKYIVDSNSLRPLLTAG